jgi:hypothetical protein
MKNSKSLIRHDPLTRVRYVFGQALQSFIAKQYAPRDPHERFAERVHALELAYEASPHYLQADFRENFAKKHTWDLIERREEILEHYNAFHEDGEFVEFLKQAHPHLYAFAKWETVCLALAEKHEASTRADGTPINEPPKKKMTPEEWREREVRRRQVKIDDKIAFAKARLESLMNVRQLLEEYDLEDLNAEGVEQELKADILVPEDEDPGSFHQA